jgi:hypothetical protein
MAGSKPGIVRNKYAKKPPETGGFLWGNQSIYCTIVIYWTISVTGALCETDPEEPVMVMV